MLQGEPWSLHMYMYTVYNHNVHVQMYMILISEPRCVGASVQHMLLDILATRVHDSIPRQVYSYSQQVISLGLGIG